MKVLTLLGNIHSFMICEYDDVSDTCFDKFSTTNRLYCKLIKDCKTNALKENFKCCGNQKSWE